jgi:lysine/ornithine N-monooxygenase
MGRRWNCYPGARVDSPVPIYQLNIPEVYNTWTFTTNYPDWKELQAYFDHVDKVCNLSKDTAFETVVTSAEFDQAATKWMVKTADGRTVKTRFLIVAAGFAAKRYIPNYKGIENYKGVVHHSSFWPPEDVDVKGKKVAVIGECFKQISRPFPRVFLQTAMTEVKFLISCRNWSFRSPDLSTVGSEGERNDTLSAHTEPCSPDG